MDGLNFFDGQNIRVYKAGDEKDYSLVDNNIQSPFFEDKEGNVWFSTVEAVNCFERKTGKIKHFKKEGVTDYRVVGIQGNDNIWVMSSSSGNLYILSPGGGFDLKHRLFGDVHWGFLDTNATGAVRHLFAYSYNKPGLQINEYQAGKLTDQRMLFDGRDGDLNLGIRHILKEDDHTFWLSTTRGSFLFNAKDGSLEPFFTDLTEESDWLNACAYFKKDFLLFAFAKSGLAIFDKRTKKIVQRIRNNPLDPHSLAGNDLTNVTLGQEGDMWVSVDGVGVDFTNIWQRRPFRQLLTSGIDSPVNFQVQAGSMVEDSKGNILCAAAKNGLFLLDPNKNLRVHFRRENRTNPSLFSNYVVHILKDSRGRIWVGTLRGLALWDDAKEKFKQITDTDKPFIFGYQLKNGEMLFCHLQGGIYKMIETGNDSVNFYRCAEFDTAQYTALIECSDGKLFAAKGNTCIEVFVNAGGSKKLDSLPINGISKCFWENKQKNEVWVASSNGLAIINLKNLTHRILTEKDGLPDRCIHSILSVDTAQIWISTNRGLSRTSPDARVFHNFTYADGLSSYEFRNFSSMLRSNGEVWFGSTNGITCFVPDQIKSLIVAATPQIVKILVNDTEAHDSLYVRSDAQNATEMKRIALRHYDNTLSFYLAALEYSDPANTKIRYYMHGVDSDTLESEGHWIARYPKLRPGTYQLFVWAANSDGEWNPEPRVLEIEILPPFWQQWWFITICIFLMLLLAWYAHRLSVRRQIKIAQLKMERQIAVEQERKRIARDMHDEIGSGLSELGLIAELTKQKALDKGVKKDLDQLIHSSREISGKLRELIWTVYAQNDNLEKLISFLHNYALGFFENSNIDCQAIFPASIPDCSMSGQKRHMILMAFKEALNNVLKHSRATSVNISFEDQHPVYLIIVRDNGVGFDPAVIESPVGYGLSNMYTRMTDIGGNCSISSDSNGTTVTFSIKM